MNTPDFNVLFEDVVDQERKTLGVKAQEYGQPGRLWNFKRGAEISGMSPRMTLWGYLVKHLTSISDICWSDKPVDRAFLREKIGDARNYLFLLEALVRDESEQHGKI